MRPRYGSSAPRRPSAATVDVGATNSRARSFQASTNGLALLLVGRFVAGLGVGIASAIVPVYQAEIAPKEIRGRMIALQQWAITWGILIHYFVQYVGVFFPLGLVFFLCILINNLIGMDPASLTVAPRTRTRALPLFASRGACRPSRRLCSGWA